MKKYDKILTKNYLYQEYIKHKKSMNIIANTNGCSIHCIYNRLKNYNIKIRDIYECQQGELHPNYGKKRPEQSKRMLGKGNQFSGKHHTEESKQKIRLKNKNKHYSPETEFTSETLKKLWKKKEFRDKQIKSKLGRPSPMKGKHIKLQTKIKISLGLGGTGIPYEQSDYPKDFYRIRYHILKRDNHICQKCKKVGNTAHHIDYRPVNCKETNLITLCHKCNCQVNGNRDYWFAYFTYLMENEKC